MIGSLVPAIAGHGLADPAELDVATLRDQIAAEQKATRSAMVVPTLVAAGATRAEPSADQRRPRAGAVHQHVGALADALADEQVPLVDHELTASAPASPRRPAPRPRASRSSSSTSTHTSTVMYAAIAAAPLPTPSTTSQGAGGTGTVRS